MTRSALLVLVSVLPALLLTSGCDDANPSDPRLDPNTFTVQAAGETGGARSPAFFAEGEQDSEAVFVLVLGGTDPTLGEPEEQMRSTVSFVRQGSTPGEGTYPLVNALTADPDAPEGFVGVYALPDTTRGARFYFAERGTLFVDEVQPGEAMQGHYEMTVREFNLFTGEPMGDPLALEGAFHALHQVLPDDGPPFGFRPSAFLPVGPTLR